MLTSTVGIGKTNGLGGLSSGTSLVGAIANTVAEVRVGAIASNVANVAVELVQSNADHVVEAVLLQTIASAHCELGGVDMRDGRTYSA